MKIIALNLHRIDKGTVLGAVSLWMPEFNFRIHDVLWGRRGPDGGEWVRLPTREWQTPAGQTRFVRVFEWGDDRTERDFRESALAAIHELVAQETAREPPPQ
jgi:hypothetical protein